MFKKFNLKLLKKIRIITKSKRLKKNNFPKILKNVKICIR